MYTLSKVVQTNLAQIFVTNKPVTNFGTIFATPTKRSVTHFQQSGMCSFIAHINLHVF